VSDDLLGVLVAPAPGEQAPDEFIAWHIDVNCGLYARAQLAGDLVGGLRLLDGAGEAVEHVPAATARREDRFVQHVHDDAVRHQVPALDVAAHRAPDRGALDHVLAEQVTAGDVGQAEALGDLGGLGALACPGGADQQHPFVPAGGAAARCRNHAARLVRGADARTGGFVALTCHDGILPAERRYGHVGDAIRRRRGCVVRAPVADSGHRRDVNRRGYQRSLKGSRASRSA
jgi:hypothetical protein